MFTDKIRLVIYFSFTYRVRLLFRQTVLYFTCIYMKFNIRLVNFNTIKLIVSLFLYYYISGKFLQSKDTEHINILCCIVCKYKPPNYERRVRLLQRQSFKDMVKLWDLVKRK